MVEDDDLPIAARGLELLLEPIELLRCGVGGLEHEEADVRPRIEGVVEMPAHVEQLVETLFARVVVAQRRVELDAGIQERLVRKLELHVEVLRALRSDQVVPAQHDRVVLEPPVEFDHLLGELVLRLAAGADVAEPAELERAIPVRQWDYRCGRRLLGLEAGSPGGVVAAPVTDPGHDEEEQEHDERQMTRAHDDLCLGYFGSALSMKSAMTCAWVSSRISQSPMNRYSRSSVSLGSVCRTWGGTVVNGTVSG